jgi:transcriptional regulator with XRE-family HTH domain
MHIGKRVRALRKSQNMKLQELAQKSGVQIATLSRIEHNKMTGTLESHIAIAKALDTDLSSLYSDIEKAKKTIDVNKNDVENDVSVQTEKAIHQILTTNVMSKKMMPSLLKLSVNGSSSSEILKPGTERFIYVVEGQLTAVIKGEEFQLEKSHSIYFDASQEHQFQNRSEYDAQLLIITTPSQY